MTFFSPVSGSDGFNYPLLVKAHKEDSKSYSNELSAEYQSMLDLPIMANDDGSEWISESFVDVSTSKREQACVSGTGDTSALDGSSAPSCDDIISRNLSSSL